MLKFKPKQVGLPPGSLVHIGEIKTQQPRLDFHVYSETDLDRRTEVSLEEILALRERPGTKWINLYGIHDIELIRALGEGYAIHPLALEDLLNTAHPPKIEVYDDFLLVILKMIDWDHDRHTLEIEQFGFILTPGTLLSFQERPGDVLNGVRERLRRANGRIRARGADYLLYALIDSVVDHYFVVLDKIDDHLANLELQLLDNAPSNLVNQIHLISKELITLRKAAWPLRDIALQLIDDESGLIDSDSKVYLRDLQDHISQSIDSIVTFREIASGLINLSMSISGNRMNEVMKVLTIMASIFIPLTFIAGIYGMNFEHMPELKWPWAYPLTLLIMALAALAMIGYFKLKRWF